MDSAGIRPVTAPGLLGASPGSAADCQIEMSPLTERHIEDIWSLFEEIRRIAPRGHLAARSRAEILETVRGLSSSASVGAWSRGRLVAYSLCSKDDVDRWLDVPIARLLRARGEELWTGKGTVVQPGFEGRLLMPRLLRERGVLMRARGVAHSAGLIAVDNAASLAGALRAGARVAGLVPDQYCLNFFCYAGDLLNEFDLHDSRTAAMDDLGRISELVCTGWVGTNMSKETTSGQRVLAFKLCPLMTGFLERRS